MAAKKSIRRKKAPVSPYVRAVRVRLYPTAEQDALLRQFAGTTRKVWNDALDACRKIKERTGKTPTHTQMCAWLTAWQRTEATAWMAAMPTDIMQQTLIDMTDAFAAERAGLRDAPRFKARGRSLPKMRFAFTNRSGEAAHPLVDTEARKIRLTRLGWVKYRGELSPVGGYKMCGVKRDSAGRWFATMTDHSAAKPDVRDVPDVAFGVDMGLKSAAVLSDGSVFAPRKPLAAKLKRLRRYQRSYSRRMAGVLVKMGLDPKAKIPKGTKIESTGGMIRRKEQIGRLHAQIADQRRDALHKLSRHLTDVAATIGIEDLSVKGINNGFGRRKSRRSANDVALGELRRQLTYKTAWAERTLVTVDRFFPSSQLCSTPGCDYRKRDLTLKDRSWHCPQCDTHHDRDVNAAINIRDEALRLINTSTARSGDDTSPGTTSCAAGIDARGESSAVDRQVSTAARRTVNSALDAPRRQPLPRRERITPQAGAG